MNSAIKHQLPGSEAHQESLSLQPVTEHQWFAHIEAFTKQHNQPLPVHLAGKTLRAVNVLSTQLAGKLVFKLWFTPQSRPISEQDHQWLTSADQEKMTFRNETIPVYQWGAGPTVLVVHGWGGHSGQFRQLAQSLVTQGYRVISFDAPGHGLATGKTTNAEEICDIIQLLYQREQPIGIISHSIGGLSSHRAMNTGTDVKFHVVLNTPMSLSHIVQGFKHQLGLPTEVIDQLKQRMERKFNPGFWSEYDLRQQHYHAAQLYCYDRKDHQVPIAVASELQQRPNTRTIITDSLGHNKTVRDDDVIQQVVAFVRENSQ
jgi:predicted alpha/beta-fold hydrolase